MDDEKRVIIHERAERYEIIDGKVYDMSPSPTFRHQSIVGAIHKGLAIGFQGTGCSVLLAPLDVRLPGTDGSTDVVQPDLFVVCDRTKMADWGCSGAPDLIVEVLSPSTAKKDKLVKLALYQRRAVREFWLVDPLNQTIEVFHFQSSGYTLPDVYSAEDGDFAPVGIREGLSLNLEEIFETM